MLELLNREKRYKLRSEYFGRLLNVALLILIVCFMYYGVLLFSTTFLINIQKSVLEAEAEGLNNSSQQKELTNYERILNHLQAEYNLFSTQRLLPTEILSALSSKNISGISLSAINVNKPDTNGVVNINLKGIARDRDTFIKYSDAFNADPQFENVNIPISSLAKTSEIPFDISMTYKSTKQNEN